jgi:hypothetical protein
MPIVGIEKLRNLLLVLDGRKLRHYEVSQLIQINVERLTFA